MYLLGYTGWISALIVFITGILFLLQTIKLYRSSEIKDARSLMFGSFLYLPIVLIALLVDQI